MSPRPGAVRSVRARRRRRAAGVAGAAVPVTLLVAAAVAWAVPDTTIGSAPPAFTNLPTATFTFSATESSTFQCKLDAAPYAACASPLTLTGLSEGPHTILIRAGAVGAPTDPSPASHSWTVDFSPPETTLTAQPAPLSASPAASFSFTSEAGATFACSLNGAAFVPCASPVDYNGLGDATRVFAVRASDPAGNVDPSPATSTWTVDATPPDTTITAGPSGPTASAQPSFELAASEPATLQCALDGAAFAACTSPYAPSGLTDGPHTLSVRAVDPVGNVDPSPAARSWVQDTLGPASAPLSVGPCRATRGPARGCLPPLQRGSRTLPVTARFQTTSNLLVRWGSADATVYDVRYERLTSSGGSAMVDWKQNVTTRSSAFMALTGRTYCFKATSRDALGNETPGAQACTTLPIRVKNLAPAALLTSAPGHYFGQYFALMSFRRLTLPGMFPVKRLALVVTKCAQCGKVRVRVLSAANVVLFEKIIELQASATLRRRVVPVVTFTPAKSVRWLELQPLGGKTMRLEGVGISPR